MPAAEGAAAADGANESRTIEPPDGVAPGTKCAVQGETSAALYLLAGQSNLQLNKSDELDAKLASLLDNNGPDMRPLRDFRHSDDITLEVAARGWRLMRKHALSAAKQRLGSLRPLVQQTLAASKVSSGCISASLATIDAGQRLHSWAIQRKFSSPAPAPFVPRPPRPRPRRQS